jgi:polysaccharide export outer membrane protein
MRLLLLALATLACDPVRCVIPKEPDPRPNPYVIGEEDLLQIHVREDSSLNGPLRVRPDGMITMALIGEVEAAGRSAKELAGEIAEALTTYLKAKPNVTIAVTEVASYKFTVTGQVEAPGVYSARNYVTVSQAIALAGGLNRYGSPKITILRRDKKGVRRIPIDLRGLTTGKCPAVDIFILRGDTIVVP